MKRISFLFFINLLVVSTYAQLLPVNNLPTPDAAKLGTFGSVPISEYTGIPQVSVPLYEVKDGNLTVPISVDYHLSTVKPHIQPGIVGLGWALSAGGQITRTVRGIPDERKGEDGKERGYYYHSSKMKSINTTNHSSFDDMVAMYGKEDGTYYEVTPDEFAFNFCGYTGTFYYNEDKGWTVISDADIKVEFEPEQGKGFVSWKDLSRGNNARFKASQWAGYSYSYWFFNKFTLVTPDGTKYEFGGIDATEYSIPYYSRQNGELIATTWNLKKITLTNGSTINFTYDPSPILCDLRYIPQYCDFSGDFTVARQNDQVGLRGFTGFLLFGTLLKSINTENETVSFDYTKDKNYGEYFQHSLKALYWETKGMQRYSPYYNPFEDPSNQFFMFLNVSYPPQASEYEKRKAIGNSLSSYYLRHIKVKTKYSEYIRDIEFSYEDTSRRRLRHIYGIDDGSYEFSYNENKMPTRYIMAKTDTWGYYYGEEWKMAESTSGTVILPNLASTLSNTLSDIVYPTGGRTHFDYELNDYSKVVNNDHTSLTSRSGIAGGLRVSMMTDKDYNGSIVKKTKYYYSDKIGGASSGILNHDPVVSITYTVPSKGWQLTLKSPDGFYPSLTNFNSPTVGYSHVIEETLDAKDSILGYTVLHFSNFGISYDGNSHFDEPLIYSTYTATSPLASFSSRSVERGKLLEKDYYAPDWTLLSKEKRTYQIVNNGSFLTANENAIIFPIADPGYGVENPVTVPLGALTKTYTYRYLPFGIANTVYQGQKEFTTKESYEYNSSLLLRKKTSDDGMGYLLISEYKYPSDDSSCKWMTDIHLINPLIEEKTKIGDFVTTIKRNFNRKQNIPYLQKVTTSCSTSSRVKTDYEVLSVDKYGNPTEIVRDGKHSVIYWGLHGQYMIAFVDNITLEEAENWVGNDFIDEKKEDIPYGNFDWLHEEFPLSRIYLYEYDDNLNLDKVTLPSGEILYYRSDNYGKLVESGIHQDLLQDDDWTVKRTPLKKYQYHYRH